MDAMSAEGERIRLFNAYSRLDQIDESISINVDKSASIRPLGAGPRLGLRSEIFELRYGKISW